MKRSRIKPAKPVKLTTVSTVIVLTTLAVTLNDGRLFKPLRAPLDPEDKNLWVERDGALEWAQTNLDPFTRERKRSRRGAYRRR